MIDETELAITALRIHHLKKKKKQSFVRFYHSTPSKNKINQKIKKERTFFSLSLFFLSRPKRFGRHSSLLPVYKTESLSKKGGQSKSLSEYKTALIYYNVEKTNAPIPVPK